MTITIPTPLEVTAEMEGAEISIDLSYPVPITVHDNLTGKDAVDQHPATAVSVDAAGFTGNLDPTDIDVQLVANKVDALITGGGGDPYELIYTKPDGDIKTIILTLDKDGVPFNFVEGDTIVVDVSVQQLLTGSNIRLGLNDHTVGNIFYTGPLTPSPNIAGSVGGANANIYKVTWHITLLNNEIGGFVNIQGTTTAGANTAIVYAISSRGFNAATINKLTIARNNNFFDAGTKVLIKKL